MGEVRSVVSDSQQILFEAVDVQAGSQRERSESQPPAPASTEDTWETVNEMPVGAKTPGVKPNTWKGITVHRESWPMLVCLEPGCDRQFQTPWPLIMNRCLDHHDKANPDHFRGQNG